VIQRLSGRDSAVICARFRGYPGVVHRLSGFDSDSRISEVFQAQFRGCPGVIQSLTRLDSEVILM
jgi:hypothetical protein